VKRFARLAASLAAIVTTPIVMWASPAAAHADPGQIPPGWTALRNYQSGLCLHAAPARHTVNLRYCYEGPLETWYLAYVVTLNGRSYYQIRAAAIRGSGCLRDDEAASAYGSDAVNYLPCDNSYNRETLWTFVLIDVGWEIKNRATGLCLTYDAGSNAISSRCDGNRAEQWQ